MAKKVVETVDLTDEQERFCEAYLLEPNAAAAAIKAGYSETSARNQGSRLLKNPAVMERIGELQKERAERTKIDADYVLFTIRDTVERCRQGETFDPPAVLKGCELLGKHLKLFTEKHEHTGKDGGPMEIQAKSLSDEEIEAKLQAYLAKGKLIE